MSERSYRTLEALSGPLYFLALLLICTPLVDILANIWPLNFGDVAWRYGAVGMFSGFVLTPLLGVALACWIAVSLGHYLLQRVLGWLSLISAVVLFVAAAGFSLDVVQLRHTVPTNPPQAMWTFEIGAAKALLKHVTAALSLVWFAVAMRRALRDAQGVIHRPAAPLVARPADPES